uniref:Uncharacterized protein n=1 Tax=Arundo donax TaxID=35708 RepID=A0A0A9FJW8_ARUDO
MVSHVLFVSPSCLLAFTCVDVLVFCSEQCCFIHDLVVRKGIN